MSPKGPKRVSFSSTSSSSSADEAAQRKLHCSSDSDTESIYNGTYKDTFAQKVLMGMTVLLFSTAYQTCSTIRYSFLADAFTKRNVPGNIFGLIEGSIFFGYFIAFITRGMEYAMGRVRSKYLMIFVLLGTCITTTGSGLAYLIEDTYVLVIVSFVFRISQGFFTYYSGLVMIDFIAARFSKYFDMLVGMTGTTGFVGHALAEGVGGVLYDNYGYVPPYFFAGSLCILTLFLVIAVMPDGPCHLASQKEAPTDTQTTKKSLGLTPYLIPALIACMFVNISYGFLQVTTTPYLNTVHGKSISYGGLVVSLSSVGMAIGALVAGIIMQKEYLLPATQMGIGSFMVGVGIFVTFPNESLKLLFDNVPIVSFASAFVVGLGDPLISYSCLRCMFQLQLQKKKQLTPKQSTLITGLWMVGYNAFWYAGSVVSGVLCEVLTYSDSADILAGMCLVSVLICEVLRYVSKTNKLSDETIPLITGH